MRGKERCSAKVCVNVSLISIEKEEHLSYIFEYNEWGTRRNRSISGKWGINIFIKIGVRSTSIEKPACISNHVIFDASIFLFQCIVWPETGKLAAYEADMAYDKYPAVKMTAALFAKHHPAGENVCNSGKYWPKQYNHARVILKSSREIIALSSAIEKW